MAAPERRYGGLTLGGILVIVGIVVAMLSLGSAFTGMLSESGSPVLGTLFGVGAVIFLPILYGLLGLIGGLIVASLYNVLAGLLGGIELDIQ